MFFSNYRRHTVKHFIMAESEDPVSTNLQVWLDKLGKHFSLLSNDEKNQTLDFVIENCESSQLFYLSEKLQVLLKRDFITYLPRELAHTLLEYMDPDTLRNCCLVSKTWNDIINSCTKAWQGACLSVGVKKSVLSGIQDASKCKELYLATCARLKTLQMGRAFESKRLYGHTDRVMAVHYKDGILATGSSFIAFSLNFNVTFNYSRHLLRGGMVAQTPCCQSAPHSGY